MKSIVKIVLIGLIGVLFIGCSAKTDVSIDLPEQSITKANNINLIIVEEDIYSIESDQMDIIEDLRDEISSRLKSLGVKTGGNGLTVKITIDGYEKADDWLFIPFPGVIGESFLSANVEFFNNDRKLGRINIEASNYIRLYEDNFKEHAEEAFVDILIAHLEENYLLLDK